VLPVVVVVQNTVPWGKLGIGWRSGSSTLGKFDHERFVDTAEATLVAVDLSLSDLESLLELFLTDSGYWMCNVASKER
jgi:hypothetical protein